MVELDGGHQFYWDEHTLTTCQIFQQPAIFRFREPLPALHT
jgi:hypothetical protein